MLKILASLKQGSFKKGSAAFAICALMLAGACTTTAVEDEGPVIAAPVEQEVEDTNTDIALPAVKNRVALLLPTTGPNARVGRSLANAANMALLDLGGGDIELEVYDTAANGPERAAQRAVDDGALVFLGPLMAENVRAIRAFARSRDIPVISYSNDAEVAGNGVYVMGFQPAQSIERVVNFARSRGIDRFAALIPSGTYGRRASDAFMASVNGAGGRVTAMETYERKKSALPASVRRLTDFEARTARAAQGGIVRADGTVAPVEERIAPVSFETLLIADGGAIASEFLQSLQRYGAGPGKVRYLGTELWNADGRIASARGLRGSWYASVPDARFNQFAGRYRAKFGGAPSRLSSLAYDSVLLVQGQAANWQLNAPFPMKSLSDPDGFVGLDGIFRFGANGVAQRGLEVQEVGPGGTKIISPAPRAFQNNRVSMLVN
ncbi:penicillin-binding protein activator [Pacificimonas sp. WHA3]|uniref:Penicillin-binding protein activator n=1 Tax=Pacificimonas pallii TaxID=2827236 RepID=A0ABS6SA62_9SPHN|nr:penicillin-binding protein activator [Pacificimonas pallii]MBV7255262.1 penicillin-binding protein activator [Pacificimonas pallii]